MDNGFLIFMIVLLGLMFLAGIHRRHLRSKIVKRMIEDEYSGSEIEKALKAYDGEEK
jgi:hypothetical protein